MPEWGIGMSLYSKIIDLQKLRAAWQKVKKNKPAAGADHMTWEQFDSQADTLLKELNASLVNHDYQANPVRMVTIFKEEKARDIALYCMKDKVVQQAAASELDRMYEETFSKSTYAYVSRRSALNAVEDISKAIQTGEYSYILKLDITHFFDEIDWVTLSSILQSRISEDDVVDLLRMNCCGEYLKEDTGDLLPKTRGIYQGSGLSPVLSNIYMKEFDQWLESRTSFYVRYADDMLILGRTKAELTELLTEISLRLQQLHLRLNEEKTCCVSVDQGIEFLGYHFDRNGRSTPAKAQMNLASRLETMWLINKEMPLTDKLQKVIEITGGWEQYYRDPHEVTSILEYASLVYACGDNADKERQLADLRLRLVNEYQDILQYLTAFWKRSCNKFLELFEYEQYYQVPDGLTNDGIYRKDAADNAQVTENGIAGEAGEATEDKAAGVDNSAFGSNAEQLMREYGSRVNDLLALYSQYRIATSGDQAIELMQMYTDLKHYNAASFWMKEKERLERTDNASGGGQAPSVMSANDENVGLVYNDQTPEKVLSVFTGREDIYARETTGGIRGRQLVQQLQPLTKGLLREHLRGGLTIATYIQRPNATVHFIVFDVDISRKVLLQMHENNEDTVTTKESYLQKAYQKARDICHLLEQMGLKGYIEFSGNRGYHVWLFLTEWITVKYARMFCDIVDAMLQRDEDITIEYFPNGARVKPGKFGQTIKIPCGIHSGSGMRSFFVDESGLPVTEINGFIDGLARFNGSSIRKVLARSCNEKESVEKREVDQDISVFAGSDDTILEVLRQCNLMRYLCLRAVKTGYLTHFERLTILYVFGHMGGNGKKFIHTVMSYTLNYSYNVTDKFIRKCPERPISCLKLQDQYKKVTAEIGCNCVFKLKKNCYPSPVLHAIMLSPDVNTDITVPISRTITAEKKQAVMDDMNIHTKAQNLAKQILEFKKQRRALDRGINDVEQQLSELFDDANVNELETDMGILTRRKIGDKCDWVIEI